MDADEFTAAEDLLGPEFLLPAASGQQGWRRALLAGRALRTLAEDSVNEAVAIARRDGATWSDIADRLGVATQTAWERYKQVDEITGRARTVEDDATRVTDGMPA